jgi:CRP-like cAMP-binding protein
MVTVANAEKTIQHYVDKYDMVDFLNDDLLSYLQVFHFPAYTNIFLEQGELDYLYFLVEGQVQCNHYHMDGRLAVFALSKPFMAIGDLEILRDETVRSNVISTQDTVMLGIAADIVQRYGANDPRFLRFIIEQLRMKLMQSNFWQESQAFPAINRLSIFMLANANDAGEISFPGKDELASLMGSTTRHLNRVLRQLVEAGAISDDYPCVHILDKEALQTLTF